MLQASDLALWTILVTLPPTFLYLRRQRSGTTKRAAAIAGGIYLALLVGVTFGPIPVDGRLLTDLREEVQLVNNWIPFESVSAMISSQPPRVFVWQIGGNLALLMPLGFLLPVMSSTFDRLRNVVLVAICVTLLIEILQLTISTMLGYSYKVFDIDDLWLNLIGAVIGWALFRLCSVLFSEASDSSPGVEELPQHP